MKQTSNHQLDPVPHKALVQAEKPNRLKKTRKLPYPAIQIQIKEQLASTSSEPTPKTVADVT